MNLSLSFLNGRILWSLCLRHGCDRSIWHLMGLASFSFSHFLSFWSGACFILLPSQGERFFLFSFMPMFIGVFWPYLMSGRFPVVTLLVHFMASHHVGELQAPPPHPQLGDGEELVLSLQKIGPLIWGYLRAKSLLLVNLEMPVNMFMAVSLGLFFSVSYAFLCHTGHPDLPKE